VLGWDVLEVDGHDLGALVDTLGRLDARMADRPLAVLAHTTKGRGVSFMENSPLWHHRMPRGDEVERARAELAGEA
jgi:transketolase